MNSVKRNYKNLIIMALMVIYIVVFRLVVFNKALKYSDGINSAFSIILLALSIFLLGFRKVNSTQYKKNFIKNVLIFVFLYFVGIYGAGLIVGFLKNSYSMEFPTILENVVTVIITIISSEVLRYVFISANKDSKKTIFVFTFLLALLEINMFVRPTYFSDITSTFKFISTITLPIIMKNVMCSYLTYQSDYKPAIVYRCLMDVYIYVLPIQPDLNDFVVSIITLLLPFLIMLYSNRVVYEKDTFKEHEFGRRYFKWIDIPFIIVVVFLLMMILDIGPYKLVGIETGSMTPAIKVGDAVVIDKNIDKDKLKVGDIIAYINKDNVLVVHRIIKINSDMTYITKGDYNNSADTLYVSKNQIKGKVTLKIPFIAYPKILFK